MDCPWGLPAPDNMGGEVVVGGTMLLLMAQPQVYVRLMGPPTPWERVMSQFLLMHGKLRHRTFPHYSVGHSMVLVGLTSEAR